MTDKILTKMKTEDVTELIGKIERHPTWSPASKQGFKITIKKFYGTMGLNKAHVEWINTTLKKKHKKLPSDMLNVDDIMKMIEANTKPRDRAIIAAFWDSGGRVGEIGTWKIRDITSFAHGVKAQMTGKTGSRIVPLVLSAPYITQWLAVHPMKDDPNAPLWVKQGPSPGHLMYGGMYRVLRESAKKAGIEKKFNPQTYRHSRATNLACDLTESQMDEYLGWVQGSNMPQVYVHLSGRNIDDAILKAAGIDVGEEEKAERRSMKPVKCHRCRQIVGASCSFCPYCGLSMSVTSALVEEQAELKIDDMFVALVAKYPELGEVMRRLQAGE